MSENSFVYMTCARTVTQQKSMSRESYAHEKIA